MDARNARAASNEEICDRLKRLLDAVYAQPFDSPYGPNTLGGQQAARLRATQDEYFVPAFGRPYDQIPAQEITALHQDALTCIGGRHISEFRDAPYRRGVIATLFSRSAAVGNVRQLEAARAGAAELADLTVQLAAFTATSEGLQQLEQSASRAKALLGRATPSEADAYNRAYREARHRIVAPVEQQEVAAMIGQPPGALGLQNMTAMLSDLEAKARREDDTDIRASRVASMASLRARIGTVEAQQAQAELADYRAYAQQAPAGLAGLADAKAKEARLKTDYGSELASAPFAEFNRARSAYRQKLLTQNTAALKAKIDAATAVPDVTAVTDQYIVASDIDSPSAAPVMQAVKLRMAVLAPFAALSGGDYFNAIYAGNLGELRQLDRAYLKGFDAMINMLRQGPFGKLIAVDKMTLLNPVMTTYLFRYQSAFGKCLRPDAAVFTETTRTDTVTTNGYGTEVSRIYGIPNVHNYRINTEFVDVFRTLGNSNQGGLMLSDMLMNKGQITSLLTGTEQLMANFACNDPKVKQLEQNMLKLHTAFE